MADIIYILGQADLAATSETDLYTVPAGGQAVLSSVVFANRNAASRTVRLYVAEGGVATADKMYIAYDVTVDGNASLVYQLGITLTESDVVRAYASDVDVSVNVFGVEQGIPVRYVPAAIAVDLFTTDDTLDATHYICLVDCTLGDVTLTLPAAAANEGRQYIIKKIDATGNRVIVDGDGVETIDDFATQELLLQYEAIQIVCDSSEWWVI